MNRIWVAHDKGPNKELGNFLKQILRHALKELRLDRADVSVALVNNREIQRLNQTYRKIKKPTDVLSFSQEEKERKGRTLLGDIVISTPTARRQARQANHSYQDECAMLAVHGLLHLLGHDHANKREAKKMFALQKKLLRKTGAHA